jgi:Raf kinase inhibitor-like YbhB/YbcL family protein
MRHWSSTLIPILLLAAGCGTRTEKAVTQFALTSPAFQDGQAIPAQFTCDGANQSPPLRWAAPPEGTRSLALVVDDPNASRGIFRHWGAYDIPASTRSMAAGQALGAQAINDSGKPGYDGPCPPRSNAPHHYRFKLFALNVDRLNLPEKPHIMDVELQAEQHVIGGAQLNGTYARK